MISNEAWLTVGKLVAPHGLRGEIRINPSSDFPERFTRPGKRWVQKINENQPNEISLLSGRQLPGKKVFVVRFAGINSRNDAQLLIGSFLLVPINDRPKLDKNEFHFLDLIGLEAKLAPDGPPIGIVSDLKSAGNDLLEIQLEKDKKILIPLVKEIVPIIQINEGWLLITPPEGLLEL